MSRNRRVGTTELLVETGAVGKWLPRVTRTWHRVQSTAGESIHTGYLACLVRLAGISGGYRSLKQAELLWQGLHYSCGRRWYSKRRVLEMHTS